MITGALIESWHTDYTEKNGFSLKIKLNNYSVIIRKICVIRVPFRVPF
jgi:hypothetical protein